MRKGRAPCCATVGLRRGSWTLQEDKRLIAYIQDKGCTNWRALPKKAGLLRCGKSCRLRWVNYLRPDLKRGNLTPEEEDTIIKLHGMLGNKWSQIASCLPGRTDNEIKNVWNTHLKKGLRTISIQGEQLKKRTCSDDVSSSYTTTNCSSGDSGEQSNTNMEEPELDKTHILMPDLDLDVNNQLLDLPQIDIMPELWSMVDNEGHADDACTETTQAPWNNEPTLPACSSSATSACLVPDQLLNLPEIIDIMPELWSMVDNADACTEETTQEPDGKERWLEDLERELGLYQPDSQGQSRLQDSPSVILVDESYFQASPFAGTSYMEPEPCALPKDIHMD